MNKLKKILESTVIKVLGSVLVISFIFSSFIYYDFYLEQINKAKGYWWVYKGDKALKKENLQAAIDCYEKGVRLHPKHYKALYNLANIYVIYEDYYSALKNYEKALKVRPDFVVARINYAIILTETYKTDRAIEEYKKVIENEPGYYKIPFLINKRKAYTYNKGVAYYNMGLAYRTKSLLAGLNKKTSREYLIRASKSYKEASDILNSYNSNYNLGLIHQVLRNQYQAGHYYCKAIKANPMNYEAHFNFAVLLNDMKDYRNAQEEFKKAGLLLDAKGDSTKTKYIYDVLSRVNQKAVLTYTDEELENLRLEQDLNSTSKYKAGKLVIFDKKEKDKKDIELIKSFRKCANSEFFIGEK